MKLIENLIQLEDVVSQNDQDFVFELKELLLDTVSSEVLDYVHEEVTNLREKYEKTLTLS